ncbi:MAG: hypothetical protein ACI837_003337 [Crocinitomicaceae bacterium]|jgi:hypothetical protein
MKLLVLFLVVITSISVGNAQAILKVDKTTFKFPSTVQGVLLKHNYKITNTGTAPLIISDYSVNCTCTKAVLPKHPIAPGETYSMKVTFDTNEKYFFQDRTILLVTNTKKKHSLRFKVKVVPGK